MLIVLPSFPCDMIHFAVGLHVTDVVSPRYRNCTIGATALYTFFNTLVLTNAVGLVVTIQVTRTKQQLSVLQPTNALNKTHHFNLLTPKNAQRAYTACIRNTYLCFEKFLSSSGGSNKGEQEIRIQSHVKTAQVCFDFLTCNILTCDWMRISCAPLSEKPDDDRNLSQHM